jgi:hypothetical protein
VLISKILLGLANGITELGLKEDYMKVMDTFLNEHRERVIKFFKTSAMLPENYVEPEVGEIGSPNIDKIEPLIAPCFINLDKFENNILKRNPDVKDKKQFENFKDLISNIALKLPPDAIKKVDSIVMPLVIPDHAKANNMTPRSKDRFLSKIKTISSSGWAYFFKKEAKKPENEIDMNILNGNAPLPGGRIRASVELSKTPVRKVNSIKAAT